MIYNNKEEVEGINIKNTPIQAVYKGMCVVWEAIRSCFGNGMWINEKPWINTDAWKNNK